VVEQNKTVKKWMIASILLSVIIILVILYLTVKPSDIQEIRNFNIKYEFFIIAICINFVYWSLWGKRLQILSNASDEQVKISWWESTKIVLANLFLAGITPSMAGGEPVRIYLLNKDGMSLGSATASVLGERLLDAIFLLICVPFAFFIFKDRIENNALSLGLTLGIFVFLIAIFLFIYAIRKPEKIKGLLIWLNKKLSRFSKKKEKESKVINRISEEVDNFHCSMLVFLKDKRPAFAKAGILTIFMWLSGWLIPSCILLGLGLHHYIVPAMAAQVFLIIIIMMPTSPGAAGVTEGGVWALYSVVILPELALDEKVVYLTVFMILFRFITYHMGLIIGAIFQYRIFKSVASFSMDMIKKEEKKN
jgi:hypothetical protein